jgi:hypothetical protein
MRFELTNAPEDLLGELTPRGLTCDTLQGLVAQGFSQ